MKKSRFSESLIIRILKEADGGRKVVDIYREHGVIQATYYQWKAKFGGMGASDIRRLKESYQRNQELLGLLEDTPCQIQRREQGNVLVAFERMRVSF